MDDTPQALPTRRALLAAGYGDPELRRLRRRGELVVVRRGSYALSTDARLRDPRGRHELLVRATLSRLGPGAVASHVSAALLHGLPLWAVPLDRAHVTRSSPGGGRRAGRVHLHVARLGPREVIRVAGVRATSALRTVLDLARSLPFEQAVVVTDAALHRGLITPEALAQALAASPPRWGIGSARRVAAFADGRGESVGESRSRVALWRHGLPAPTPQWEVRTPSGALLGRSDFGWPEYRVVGEFDGRVKYGRLLRPGEEPGDIVFREKRREDRIRGAEWQVERWTWADLDRFDEVAERLHRKLRNAA